jgi:NAD(P)-dependent dehydrogenase (short-subunit alcohol dehydrogenase family)
MVSPSKVCAVFGFGPKVGASVARKWSSEGYKVAIMSRKLEKLITASKDIPNSKGFACDVTVPENIDETIASIEADLGPIDVLVWNAGNGVWKVRFDL